MNNNTQPTPSWAEGLERPPRRGLPMGNWDKIITAADIADHYEEQDAPAPVDIVDRAPRAYDPFAPLTRAELEERARANAQAQGKAEDTFSDFPTRAEMEEKARAAALAEAEENGDTGWTPVDLAGILDGTWKPPEPSIMRRSDGHGLLYPGLVHTFQGESGSGKSMLAQAVAVQVLEDGGRVAYIDFESGPGEVAHRLIELGATRDEILERFDYINPSDDPTTELSFNHTAWSKLLHTKYELVVIDGVNESLSVFGYKMIDNDDITTWGRAFPRTLARRTGAAVLTIDHVTKSKDGRGRYAIGGQAKMAYLTGASYTVEPTEHLAPGKVGALSIRVGKDRPGGVSAHCGKQRAEDLSQLAANVTVDSTTPGCIEVTVQAPPLDAPRPGPDFRFTGFMEKLSRVYEDAARDGETLTQRDVYRLVPGAKEHKSKALKALAAEGYIRRQGDGYHAPYVHDHPYRQADDPESDHYAPPLG